MAYSYTDWLSLSTWGKIRQLGFSLLTRARVKEPNMSEAIEYRVYNHPNEIHVIFEQSEQNERVYIIRNGFSIYLFDDQCLYAGSIIKANMDSCFEWCENPTNEIEDILNTLNLQHLIK